MALESLRFNKMIAAILASGRFEIWSLTFGAVVFLVLFLFPGILKGLLRMNPWMGGEEGLPKNVLLIHRALAGLIFVALTVKIISELRS